MRIDVKPENPIEWAIVKFNLAPTPLMHSLMSIIMARALMAGSKFRVFEELGEGRKSAAELASACGMDERAGEKLLGTLVSLGYLEAHDGRYALAPVARKWMLPSSPTSMHDYMLFRYFEWDVLGNLEEFLKTGQSIDLHERGAGEADWESYQLGMRSLASVSAEEVAAKVPVPQGATKMLDIGGSHGYYSVMICRRHEGLSSVILDLPQAVKYAEAILAEEDMGDRVVHRAGDALTDDLGEEEYDVVLISQLVHHFDEPMNQKLAKRVARSLRPGGVYVILDMIRPRSPGEAGQMGALLDLYFALTSQSGTWSVEEMQAWQREAGLVPNAPVWPRSLPGAALVSSTKS